MSLFSSMLASHLTGFNLISPASLGTGGEKGVCALGVDLAVPVTSVRMCLTAGLSRVGSLLRGWAHFFRERTL